MNSWWHGTIGTLTHAGVAAGVGIGEADKGGGLHPGRFPGSALLVRCDWRCICGLQHRQPSSSRAASCSQHWASSMLRSRASRWAPGNAPPETACWPRCRGQPGKCAARGQPSHREGDARLKRRLGISRASTLQMPSLPPPAQPALLPQLPSLTHRFHANLFGMSLEPSAVG